MNAADATVPSAVETASAAIAVAVDAIAERMRSGAGSSTPVPARPGD